MAYFEAKMHQIRFRLELRPDPAGGAYSVPGCPSWISGAYTFMGKGRKGRVGGLLLRDGDGKGKEIMRKGKGERKGRKKKKFNCHEQ